MHLLDTDILSLLTASIVLANNATLVTRNVRHFAQIPDLKIVNWAK